MEKPFIGRKQAVAEDGKRLNMYLWPTGRCESYHGIEIHPIREGDHAYVRGYMYNGDTRYRLDRLVASTFLKKPKHPVRLMHLNNNNMDCHIDNLHWLTQEEIVEMYQNKYGLTEDIVLDETWRIVGTERGHVEVSSLGNVRDPKTKSPIPTYDNHGYRTITFWNPNTKRTKSIGIHRLVATAFIPNPKEYRIVNHLDCDKSNNCVYNLEWCDDSMNCEHAYVNVDRGGITVEAINKAVELMNEGTHTDVEISNITGLTRKYISKMRYFGPRKDATVNLNLEPTSYKHRSSDVKDQILKLITEGKSRKEIFKELGFGSKPGDVSYYERVHREYIRDLKQSEPKESSC